MIMKKFQRGFTLHELLIGMFLVLWLAAVGGILYVAWHFISKWW
jgi:prepilin-type N-terminal cleavage/methylation domain-containing protein